MLKAFTPDSVFNHFDDVFDVVCVMCFYGLYYILLSRY